MDVYVIVVSLGVGTAMIGLWTMLLLRRRVPELEAGTVAIRFHLAAELVTGVGLLIGGIGLWADASWSPPWAAAALGMALYSCIASPGYYADRGERGPVFMFAILVLVVALAIGVLVTAG